MARRPQIHYFESRGAYYCQHKGKQHRLATGPDDFPEGPTYKAATKAFLAIWEMGEAEKAGAGNKVGVILAQYLLHIEQRRRPATVQIRRDAFKAFGAACGEIAISSLKHHHVYEFLTHQREQAPTGSGKTGRGRPRGWGDGQTRICLASLQAAFNWAVRSGLVPTNPLKGIETPGPRSRSREALITPTQHAKLMKLASPQFREVLICLESSGARPGELCAAEARYWDDSLGALVYQPDTTRRADEFGHKSSAKKERVILFTGAALATIRRLIARYPAGPLFRNRRGRAWTSTTLWERMWELREEVGNPNLSPYSYRHTLATSWLKAGRNIDQLAAILGNTPTVIRHHYAHLLGDVEGLRGELEAFRAAQEPPAIPGEPPAIAGRVG